MQQLHLIFAIVLLVVLVVFMTTRLVRKRRATDAHAFIHYHDELPDSDDPR